MQNFSPAHYTGELDGKAFSDHLGEFTITVLEVEDFISKTQLISDVVGAAATQNGVKRIMVIPDSEDGTTYNQLRGTLSHVSDETKRITLFAMQPMPGGNFHQEILGYSLMSALGIKASEIK